MTLLEISEPGEGQAPAACPGRAVGIDLGTTNSLVATVTDGQPRVIADALGRPLLPSVVHYSAGGEVVVGAEAQPLAAAHPAATISSVKRFMGRGQKDAEATRRLTPYRFAPGEEGVVRFDVGGGRRVTPVEVSAEILRVLAARAEAALGGPLDGAVITVPAYFDDAQRQATKDAGRLAGLEVLRLLSEPTAAALAYGLDKGSQGRYAVYDLGGGTFDVSLLKLEGGVFEVLAIGGDSALGGDDFDRAIAERVLEGTEADAGLVRRVLDEARAARERLTDAEETTLAVPPQPSHLGGGDDRKQAGLAPRRLRRAELEEWIRPVVERTLRACRRTLADAGLEAADLDGVILVGGATRTPLVRRLVAELFGRPPLADIDPDQVVALGAAVQADILAGAGRRDDVLLLDVIPLSLGLETMGGVVERIIPRNSTIPCGATQTFTTFADNQTGFDVHVLQGERDRVEDCRSLGRFLLRGLPPAPAGVARAQITFLVDADGILRVTAREERTGIEAGIEVKPSYGLSDAEIERMIVDSYEHAHEDKAARDLAVERVEADRVLLATRSALAADADLVTPEDALAIERQSAALLAARAGEDPQAIRAAVLALDAAARPFIERRMNRSLEKAVAGRTVAEVEEKV